jgi:hypothetical protein
MDCVHHWKIETPNGAGSAGSWSAGSCIRHRFAAAFRIPPFHRDSWSLVGLRVKHHRWLPPVKSKSPNRVPTSHGPPLKMWE